MGSRAIAGDGDHSQPSTTATAGVQQEYNQFMVCGTLFECPAHYAPIKPIGKGAYGIVCSARNLLANEKIAIKKISNAFENSVDAKRTLREVALLSHLRHENVIGLRDILPPASQSPSSFKDVYLVYDLMDTDLHNIIRSSQPLTSEHTQYFIYQILRGLKYVHSANVLHRDLKPSNLLVNANCDLKIGDFGLARTGTGGDEQAALTEYVVTRWYRAPELLLSCTDYTSAIDVWSVGCIMAELLARKPLFPGKDYVQQLDLIIKVLGSPDEADMAFVSSDKARRYLRSLPQHRRQDLKQLLPGAEDLAIDLLSKMLVFDPFKRISVEDALAHPWLAALHDETDEPVAEEPFSFEVSGHLPPSAAAKLMWDEMLRFHPEVAGRGTAAGAPATVPATARDDQQRTIKAAGDDSGSSIHAHQPSKPASGIHSCTHNSDLTAAEDQAALSAHFAAAVGPLE